MITLNEPHSNAPQFVKQTEALRFIKVTRYIPMCCQRPMLQIGAAAGRQRYYRCPVCQNTARGSTSREQLP